jgi:hypothetical protein
MLDPAVDPEAHLVQIVGLRVEVDVAGAGIERTPKQVDGEG